MIVDALLGAGIVQGIILVFLLFLRKTGPRAANRILAFLMLVFASNIVYTLVIPEFFRTDTGAFVNYGGVLQYLFGPLVYLYIRAITERQAFRLKDLLHFIPFCLVMIFVVANLVHDNRILIPVLSVNEGSIHDILFWGGVIIQLSVYIVFSVKEMHRYRYNLEIEYSSVQRKKLDWMHFFIVLFCCITLLYSFLLVLRVYGHEATFFPKIISLALSIVVYGIGYRGLLQQSVPFVHETTDRDDDGEPGSEKAPLGKEAARYRKSGMTSEELVILEQKLKTYLVTEKPFLEPEISLSSLATRMGLSRNRLSRVINERMMTTFYNLINLYRIEAVKILLRDPARKNDKILTIASDAGFHSKAVFNKSFKELTGMTPREFRENK